MNLAVSQNSGGIGAGCNRVVMFLYPRPVARSRAHSAERQLFDYLISNRFPSVVVCPTYAMLACNSLQRKSRSKICKEVSNRPVYWMCLNSGLMASMTRKNSYEPGHYSVAKHAQSDNNADRS